MNTIKKIGIGTAIAGSLVAGAVGKDAVLPAKTDCELTVFMKEKQICITVEQYDAIEKVIKGEAEIR